MGTPGLKDPQEEEEEKKSQRWISLNVCPVQIDVLEDPLLRNVVILQTVLQEVRHRSAPVYKRLKDILHEKEKHFYTFTNEHHRLLDIKTLKRKNDYRIFQKSVKLCGL